MMKNKELEKLEDAMRTIRQERLKYVEKTLTERRTEAERIAKVAGTEPVTPTLTISDFQLIEDRFNKPLAELREKHRLAEAEAATVSIDAIEDAIDAAQSEADKARAILAEKEEAVKHAEGRLKIAQGIITRSQERHRKIVFKSHLPELMDKRVTDRQRRESEQKILNY